MVKKEEQLTTRNPVEDLEDMQRYIEELTVFLPLAFCTINPLDIILGINQAFQDLTGYKEMEIIGGSIEVLFTEKKKISNFVSKLSEEKERITKEFTLLRRDKKEIPVSVSGLARRDEENNFLGYFLTLSDVTETKKFQEELERKVAEKTRELENSRTALMNMLEDVEEARKKAEAERDKTQTIVANLTDGLVVFDKNSIVSLVNLQTEDFFKVKSKDIIGKSIADLNEIPGINLLENLLGAEIKGAYRKELITKEGLTLEVSAIPLISGAEKLGALVILHDISREKTIEKIKTEFVSITAHQLRTPLSSIKWTLRMLLDGDLGEITDEQREFIEKTYTSNEKMISLINDLLDVTRIEEGRYLYRPVLGDIEEILQSMLASYNDLAKARRLRIDFKKSDKKMSKVMVDVEKIRLAIQNLLENAIRYTPVGGTITVSLKRDKKEVIISIKDSGVGIPKDQRERVFSKFFRATNVVKMETEGSGLGLFITKNIIEAHGGRIWFESEEGKGANFFFTIPIKEEFETFIEGF